VITVESRTPGVLVGRKDCSQSNIIDGEMIQCSSITSMHKMPLVSLFLNARPDTSPAHYVDIPRSVKSNLEQMNSEILPISSGK
jgi:hypothetical protein